VVDALRKDGWAITNDPLTISYGQRDLFVDLAAEMVTLGAERAGQRIAVEVSSFLNPSQVRDLQETLGQYMVYRTILAETDLERLLYLAVPEEAFEGILAERLGQLIITRLHLRLLVFNRKQQKVIRWIN